MNPEERIEQFSRYYSSVYALEFNEKVSIKIS